MSREIRPLQTDRRRHRRVGKGRRAGTGRKKPATQVYQAGLAQEMNANADELLKAIDTTGRKALFIAPKDILGKKDN